MVIVLMNRFFSCRLWLALIALACPAADVRGQTIEADSVLIRLIEEVDVPSRALGALVEVHVVEGTVVTKGQLLARIDDTEARLDQQRAGLGQCRVVQIVHRVAAVQGLFSTVYL